MHARAMRDFIITTRRGRMSALVAGLLAGASVATLAQTSAAPAPSVPATLATAPFPAVGCATAIVMATSEEVVAARRRPTPDEIASTVQWCTEPAGGQAAVLRVRSALSWTMKNQLVSAPAVPMTFDCLGVESECWQIDIQVDSGAARRNLRITLDPQTRRTAGWHLPPMGGGAPRAGVPMPMNGVPVTITLVPTDSAGWWYGVATVPFGTSFRGMQLQLRGTRWALDGPQHPSPGGTATPRRGAQATGARLRGVTSVSLIGNVATGGPVVYDARGVASVGVSARWHGPEASRSAMVVLRPETVIRPWEQLEVDPNRRFPRAVPENRADLLPWRPAAGAFLFLDTPRVDATGAVATVRIKDVALPWMRPLGMRALATEDGRGRLSAAGLSLGDPTVSPLALRGALLRLLPGSGATSRWPWAYSADVTTVVPLRSVNPSAALRALGDSAHVGQIKAGWTTTGSLADLATRPEAVLLGVATPLNGATRLQVGHERIGRGFGVAGAAFAPRDGLERSAAALEWVRSAAGTRARGLVWSATANWTSQMRELTAFRRGLHSSGAGEGHATLALARFHGADSSGARPGGARLLVLGDRFAIPGVTRAILPGISVQAWRTGVSTLTAVSRTTARWSGIVGLTAQRTIVFSTLAPGAQVGGVARLTRESPSGTLSLEMQTGALWSCGAPPPARLASPGTAVVSSGESGGCVWAATAGGVEAGWNHRTGSGLRLDVRARLLRNQAATLHGVEAAPGPTLAHTLHRDRLDASGVRGLVRWPLARNWAVGMAVACEATAGRTRLDELRGARSAGSACTASSALTRTLW